jgi:hypothetical protein
MFSHQLNAAKKSLHRSHRGQIDAGRATYQLISGLEQSLGNREYETLQAQTSVPNLEEAKEKYDRQVAYIANKDRMS